MKRPAIRVALAVVVAAFVACSAGDPGPGIDVDRALGHAAALVKLGPHPGESPEAQRAIAYIEQAIAGVGGAVERVPVGAVTIPEIRVLGRTFRQARAVTKHDPNLVVRFGPRDGKALLLIAHYDTVATSPGAVDNSAAVGVLVELARVLAGSPPASPVMIVFSANEEVGLVGAEAFAERRGDEVELAIALDLVGSSGALSVNGASTLIGARELRWLAGAADRAGVVLRVPLPHRVVSRWWPQTERSDHGPFTRRGIRALHLYNRGHDGERIDLAYHSERDTFDRIDRDALDELGRLLLALATVSPPEHGGGDGFWLPVAVNTVVPRWWVLAIELALAALALAILVRSRDPRTKGLGLLAGIACFTVATAVTIAIERWTSGTHPAPWLHAPLYSVIALALVFVGSLALATRLAARFGRWTGERRYLSVAIGVPLVAGTSLVFAGGAEIAWVWLVPAAVIAVAPRLGRARAGAIIVAGLPASLILAPDELREAAWNGFLPASVALTYWLAVLAIPVVATGAWYLRSKSQSGPLGTFILPVGAGLAMIIGSVMLLRHAPPCTGAKFHEFHVGCEMRTEVR